ncbi:MAG: CpaD family pilus assembly lipoprotein [Aestuariivirga sp.]
MYDIVKTAPKLLLIMGAFALSGCMTTDAALGDFDHAPAHASDRYPITLVNGPQGPKAQVRPCGNWNSDLADTKQNRPYENLGCAVQTNIAAEIVDPTTIDRPHAVALKDSNTEVSAVVREESAVSIVTMPTNYTYQP